MTNYNSSEESTIQSIPTNIFTASTANGIKNQILAAGRAGGGTVVILGQTSGLKTYVIDNIVMSSNVRLISRGGVLLQSPKDSRANMLSVPAGTSNTQLESLTFDHTPAFHGSVYHGPRVRPDYNGTNTVASSGTHSYMTDVEVRGSALDAIRFGAGSSMCGASYCRVYDSDRFGISGGGSVASPTEGFMCFKNEARRTYASAFGANGPIVNSWFLYNEAYDTGGSGDAIAAYGQYNRHLKVIGNIGTNLGNNGAHLAAYDLVARDNTFVNPAEHGLFIQASQQARQQYASIFGNYVEGASRTGLHIGHYDDVDSDADRVVNVGQWGVRLSSSDNVTLTNPKVRGCGSQGIDILGSRKVTIRDPSITGHALEGILGRVAPNGSRAPNNVKIFGADIEGGTFGIRATAGNRWIVDGYDIRGNSQANIDLDAVPVKSVGLGF